MRCDAVSKTMVGGDKSRLEHHLAGVAEDRSLSEMVLCGSKAQLSSALMGGGCGSMIAFRYCLINESFPPLLRIESMWLISL